MLDKKGYSAEYLFSKEGIKMAKIKKNKKQKEIAKEYQKGKEYFEEVENFECKKKKKDW